jgi:polyhydroxyalkanoate synthesis regulator phasin
LQDAFDEWFHEYKKVNNKNTLLQRKIWSISKDFDVLQKKKDALLTINIDLKRQLDSLKNTSNS